MRFTAFWSEKDKYPLQSNKEGYCYLSWKWFSIISLSPVMEAHHARLTWENQWPAYNEKTTEEKQNNSCQKPWPPKVI